MVAEHRDHAEGRRQVAKRANVRRDVVTRDVDHVAGLDDQFRLEGVRPRHDLLHLVFSEVHAGVQVGEMEQPKTIETGREVRE